MATISSTSTFAEIEAAVMANAGYAEDGSASMAKAFITAVRALIFKLPRRHSHGGGGNEVEYDLVTLQKEIQAAQQWLTANGGASEGGACVKHVDFREFRT